ncbi:MAG TPA: MBL fold metallo-hydrolase [Solirubrobacteraceae bacterium]|jgi:L-ascorbate metabolism protein UlaG (beta-lactamase superfamily)|nr:MBL fold metallo-hydrolase [Solirubrobacteraceae bacterium]
MRVEWYGQSAFLLTGAYQSVFIDPFGDVSAALAARSISFDYPPITGVGADLLLITHEHLDHNAVEVIDGEPAILRSTAGRLDSPIGEVVAVASEHDGAAGTERGPNTIFVFTLDGLRVAHLGDLGQPALRPEQLAAIGEVDLAFVPVGDGPTLGADQAAAVVEALGPRWVVPMHYRTPRINFLEPADAFLELIASVHTLDAPSFETGELPDGNGPLVVVPAAP